MISFDEALALIAEAAKPLGTEPVTLAEAHKRVLAQPVIAMVDAPPRDVSAMDGYAVREADLPGRLPVTGTAYPGEKVLRLEPGTCIRIFTGGPVPEDADRIVIQEEVQRDGDVATFGAPAGGRHIRKCGADFTRGTMLLDTGRRLDPRALVAAAGADVGELEVWRQPLLAIFGTGDELTEAGRARDKPGMIPESLIPGVAALAEECGGLIVMSRRLKDNLPELEQMAGWALERADLVVVTGGASVGEKDYAKKMFAPAGLELIFAKVAIKPGKPVWLGRAGGRLVMGLPGNPSSAMVTARLLLAPLIAGLTGRPAALHWRTAALAAPLGPCDERETFVRALWDGERVLPASYQDSAAQKTLADAELLIRRRPGAPAAEVGEAVEIIDF
ncbi:molybdopterin molybdotransferase MoeA [Allosphingosinicella sp.]|uniref:molybdopterin molybdotransferase MoeA n=1 Tax=Allosphingosinicella sp. TaxID=2823234 RepID=UPI003783B333